MHNLETAHTCNMCRFKDTRLDLFGSNLLETVCDKVGQPGCWIVGLVTRAFYHRSWQLVFPILCSCVNSHRVWPYWAVTQRCQPWRRVVS